MEPKNAPPPALGYANGRAMNGRMPGTAAAIREQIRRNVARQPKPRRTRRR